MAVATRSLTLPRVARALSRSETYGRGKLRLDIGQQVALGQGSGVFNEVRCILWMRDGELEQPLRFGNTARDSASTWPVQSLGLADSTALCEPW